MPSRIRDGFTRRNSPVDHQGVTLGRFSFRLPVPIPRSSNRRDNGEMVNVESESPKDRNYRVISIAEYGDLTPIRPYSPFTIRMITESFQLQNMET